MIIYVFTFKPVFGAPGSHPGDNCPLSHEMEKEYCEVIPNVVNHGKKLALKSGKLAASVNVHRFRIFRNKTAELSNNF